MTNLPLDHFSMPTCTSVAERAGVLVSTTLNYKGSFILIVDLCWMCLLLDSATWPNLHLTETTLINSRISDIASKIATN